MSGKLHQICMKTEAYNYNFFRYSFLFSSFPKNYVLAR